VIAVTLDGCDGGGGDYTSKDEVTDKVLKKVKELGISRICLLYDAVVLDILWFCHAKVWILPGTEDMTEAYHDYGYHVKASCVGMLIGLPVCLLIGLVVQILSRIAA